MIDGLRSTELRSASVREGGRSVAGQLIKQASAYVQYLSPDSINKTLKLGSSERRAARTQPAVPTGDFSHLGDGDKGKLASSHDDDIVLGPKQVLAGGTVDPEVGHGIF